MARGSISFSRGTTVNTRSSIDSPVCINEEDGTVHDVHCEDVWGVEATVRPFHVAKDLLDGDAGFTLCTACLGSDEFLNVLEGDR